MQPRHIPCTRCGAEILPVTADRTGGLCMGCYANDDGLRYELVITGHRRGARKVAAVSAIHVEIGGTLAEAKRRIERVLEGERVVLHLKSQHAITRAAKTLYETGFTVELR